MSIDDKAASLYVSLGRLVRALRQETEGSPIGPGGLSALFTLSRTGPLRSGALAATEGISAPSLTRILHHLEEQGLIERSADPDDGRAQVVALTSAGAKLIASGLEARLTALRARLAALEPDDRTLIHAALPALERLAGAPEGS